MAVTLDDFSNYTNQPEVNVTKIYQEAAQYAKQIRIFTIATLSSPPVRSAAVNSSGGTAYDWGVPSEDTLGGGGASPSTGGVAPRRAYFSAECWGTGVELAKANPTQAIGLICAARGGAAIQSFMSKAAVAKCPHAVIINPPHFGGVSAWWTGMIEPLRFIRPTGFVWHQGEENAGQPVDYTCFQPAMISDWQQTFAAHGGAPHIPFIFVQLQPCGIPPEMRYAQAQSLTEHSGIPGVGMAVCYGEGLR